MAYEYRIEQLGRDQRWFILGSARTSGDAQSQMRDYQRLFSREAFRVTEWPGAKLIVCHDPLTDEKRALARATSAAQATERQP